MTTVVHGDDFTTLATETDQQWFAAELKKRFSIKERGIMGPDSHDIKEIRLLNRVIGWEKDHIRWEADQRHGEILIESLSLKDAHGVQTPGIKENDKTVGENDSDLLAPEDATAYRAGAARCNFLALDRPDIQFAAKEVSRSMAAPTVGDVPKLKRLARYLKQFPRAVFKFQFQAPQNNIRIYADTDWAGCIKTRKSTQGGIVLIGNNCLKNWSSTQANIALSSAEAEYYGIVKAASIGLGLRSMFADMQVKFKLEILTDASAAKGIASRRGLGKVRHLEVHYLWVQDHVASGNFILRKVWGKENPADLLTKYLDFQSIQKFTKLVGLENEEGRAAAAPTVGGIFSSRRLVSDRGKQVWAHGAKACSGHNCLERTKASSPLVRGGVPVV